jgi:hypothetical protein
VEIIIIEAASWIEEIQKARLFFQLTFYVDGDFTDITAGEFLALALTEYMQDVNRDEYLWVRWHPEPLPGHEG